MKHFKALFFTSAWLCLGLAALADDTAPTPPTLYKPAQTTVAILPVINKEDSKVDLLKDRHVAKAKEELGLQFTSHGFKLADDAAVAKAIADGKIDLTDEENQRRAVFYQIGKAVNADLVVFVVIESVSRHNKSNSLFGQQKEGKALLKMWLVDADQEKPIINAVQMEGKSASNAFMDNQVLPDTNGYTRFTIRAVGHGVDDELKGFLTPYPVIKSQDDKK